MCERVYSPGLTLAISLPFSVDLCVKQPIIHHLNIHSFDGRSAVANRHGGTDISMSQFTACALAWYCSRSNLPIVRSLQSEYSSNTHFVRPQLCMGLLKCSLQAMIQAAGDCEKVIPDVNETLLILYYFCTSSDSTLNYDTDMDQTWSGVGGDGQTSHISPTPPCPTTIISIQHEIPLW